MLGQVYGELPFMILPLYASIEKLDLVASRPRPTSGRRLSAALARHAPPHRPRHGRRLPARLHLLLAFLAPDLLGGGRTAYVGNLVQSQFAVARDMPFGAAVSFLLTLAALALLWLFRRPLRAASEA